ncbi:uncharacterized protein LOC113749669 [Coffea eugenioides]|uniref:uncharacterized protein LOC113749669 n=1 Tax=Coffea eugenioides TaxID=49369 RepID=UPI000F61374E|nr:uncharacterized protein LOC113749669 [Coffea eugenioides]
MASVTKHMIPQILLFVVCVVIFNHTAKIEQQKQQRPPETEETVVTAAKSATMTTTSDLDTVPEGSGGDVKEIFGVRIERNPSQFKLDELSVTSWPTWTGNPSQIPWTFAAKETMYLLEGKVKVYCDGHDDFFEIGAGDLVEFPKGMKITWHVIEAVKKHYNLDK